MKNFHPEEFIIPPLTPQISAEFISLCQGLLSEAIGPIGKIIYKKTISSDLNYSCQKFIETLAKRISDNEKSYKFKNTLTKFLERNIDSQTPIFEILVAVEKLNKSAEVVTNFDLQNVVAKMRNVGGVKIKDRRHLFKIHSNCFVGSEAVEWMVEKLNISREQAIQLGQRLMDEKIIYHVVHKESFQNANFFYRFYWDDKY